MNISISYEPHPSLKPKLNPKPAWHGSLVRCLTCPLQPHFILSLRLPEASKVFFGALQRHAQRIICHLESRNVIGGILQMTESSEISMNAGSVEKLHTRRYPSHYPCILACMMSLSKYALVHLVSPDAVRP